MADIALNPVTPCTNGALVSSTNPLPVSVASATVSMDATATAAAPTYIEGSPNPFSQTLTGGLRSFLQPGTAGGLSISSAIMAATTNATSVKNAAGQLYAVEVTNNSANIAYLKIYNSASAPTPGSGTPVIRLMCPGNASGAGIVRSWENGIAMGTGIGYAFTGAIADNDTTAVAASAFIVNLYYK